MTSTKPILDRVFEAILGTQEVHALWLGERLGYYRDLHANGASRPLDVAKRTGTDERLTREWLEHQAVAGYLAVDDVAAHPSERRFSLPAEHVAVLVDRDDLDHIAPIARFVAGLGKHLDAIAEGYRTGMGVSWEQLGEDPREGQAAMNRPLFLGPFPNEHLPEHLPAVAERLRSGGRVAEIGFGGGWAMIGMAKAYPNATFDGFEVDAASVALASRNAQEAGVADRVTFHHVDGAEAPSDEPYDLVCAFECIHDLPDPVAVLGQMRSMVAPGGTVLVMDENVAEAFTAPGDEVERVMYGFSITCCLPDGLSARPSVGTGTVMRPSTFTAYAQAAGFEDVEILPIENDFFRFYRLT